jgi:hypothetical protein
MPTVYRKEGFKFVIYPGDHIPPHIHVIKAGGQARIKIGENGEAASLAWVNDKMNDRDAFKALKLVQEFQSFLLEKWRRINE